MQELKNPPPKKFLSRLKDAGLQSMPGAGAEILTDSVKEIISPKKISSDDWIRIMDESHSIGIPVFCNNDVWSV